VFLPINDKSEHPAVIMVGNVAIRISPHSVRRRASGDNRPRPGNHSPSAYDRHRLILVSAYRLDFLGEFAALPC
jgi:hypothetical protein